MMSKGVNLHHKGKSMTFIFILSQMFLFQLNYASYYSFPFNPFPISVRQEKNSLEEVKLSKLTAQIASNSVNNVIKCRYMFVYLDKQLFTKQNVMLLLNHLSVSHPEPNELRVVVFSSKEMLERAIESHHTSVDIKFSNTPAGRKAEKEWAAKHEPLPTGYYRAYLSRSGEKETILYSPNPLKKTIKVLKDNKRKQ